MLREPERLAPSGSSACGELPPRFPPCDRRDPWITRGGYSSAGAASAHPVGVRSLTRTCRLAKPATWSFTCNRAMLRQRALAEPSSLRARAIRRAKLDVGRCLPRRAHRIWLMNSARRRGGVTGSERGSGATLDRGSGTAQTYSGAGIPPAASER